MSAEFLSAGHPRGTLVAAIATVAFAGGALPASAAAACDRDLVRVVVQSAKDGPNDRLDAAGQLRDLPAGCRRSTWDAALELREDGRWTSLQTRRLSRGELRRGFTLFGTVPTASKSVRIRFRIKAGGREIAHSRSILVDTTTFADLPSVE